MRSFLSKYQNSIFRTLAWSLPPALIIFLQAMYTVPFYQWDEWDSFAPFVTDGWHFNEALDYLWRPHNAHRIPLAKGLYWLVSNFTLSTQPLMYLSTALTVGAFLLLIRALSRHQALPTLHLFLLSSLFFSLNYAANFFTGINVVWQVIQFSLVIFCIGLAETRYLWMLFGGVLAFLSLGVWPVFILLYGVSVLWRWRMHSLWGHKLPKKAELLAAASVIALFVLTFLMANPQLHETSPLGSSFDFIRICQYFVLILGLPFRSLDPWFQYLAGGLFIIASGSAIYLANRERRPIFIYLILSAALTALLISVGRANAISGLPHERYTGPLMPAWVALFCFLLQWDWHQRFRWVKYVVFSLLWAHLIFSIERPIRMQRSFYHRHYAAQRCIKQVLSRQKSFDENQDCIDVTYPDASFLDRARAILEEASVE